MNTKISYLYRDADNTVLPNECIIPGIITQEQQALILDSLDCGEFFIPSKVGLPENRFLDFNPSVDHPFFELREDGFSYTNLPPTVKISPEILTKAFIYRKGKWDALGASALNLLVLHSAVKKDAFKKKENPLKSILKGKFR